MKLKPSEHDIQKSILEYLLMRGHFVWRQNTGVMEKDGRYIRFGKKGTPDILGITKYGHGIAIEVKRPGGKITDEQESFMMEYISRGAHGVIAYDLQDVINAGL